MVHPKYFLISQRSDQTQIADGGPGAVKKHPHGCRQLPDREITPDLQNFRCSYNQGLSHFTVRTFHHWLPRFLLVRCDFQFLLFSASLFPFLSGSCHAKLFESPSFDSVFHGNLCFTCTSVSPLCTYMLPPSGCDCNSHSHRRNDRILVQMGDSLILTGMELFF